MKQLYYKFLALFFYYLGDLLWKIICWTDWNEITRKVICGACWSGYQKSMSLSLKYDEKVGYFIWKLPENNLDN
jgi:hypothetical protein